MLFSWRPHVLAVAGMLTAGLGVAAAQTVIVTEIPANAPVEVAVADHTVGSGAADAEGVARVPANLLSAAEAGSSDTEAVLDVHLDSCAGTWRVVTNVHGFQPPAPAVECVRKDIAGPFVVRKVTTLVIDASDPPSVKIRQGKAPAAWLRHGAAAIPLPVIARNGLSLYAGGGVNDLNNFLEQSCGDAGSCGGSATQPTVSVGAVYWLTSFLGADVAYVKPRDATSNGSGTNVTFRGKLDMSYVSLMADAGVRLRRVRLYGQGGVDYHQATTSTTQTVPSTQTALADGTPVTLQGGTQTFTYRTGGWGWIVGGGMDIWINRSAAIYAQGGLAAIKGRDLDGGDASIDDRAGYLSFGVRFHVFGDKPHRPANTAPAAAGTAAPASPAQK